MDFTPSNVVAADCGAYLSRTQLVSDPDSDRVVAIHTTQFDGLVDIAQSMANEGLHGSKEMKLVGLYPPHMPEVCCTAWGITWEEFWSDKKWIRKMLNDPMFSKFRIAPGQC